jgi:hypothetical protein
MSARLLRFGFLNESGTPSIVTRDGRLVGTTKYEQSMTWRGNRIKMGRVTGRRVTIRTPEGEVVWVVDQQGTAHCSSPVRILSADDVPLGVIWNGWMYDRDERPIAWFKPKTMQWSSRFRVFDYAEAGLIATVALMAKGDGGRVNEVEFQGPATHELRRLTISLPTRCA